MIKTLIFIIGFIFVGLIFAALQRKFAPGTLINGYMDRDKAEELAPEIFEKMSDDEKTSS